VLVAVVVLGVVVLGVGADFRGVVGHVVVFRCVSVDLGAGVGWLCHV
jgi:hypothetical protein